jgi:hypothetical protein
MTVLQVGGSAGDVGRGLADGTRWWLEMLVAGREEACSGNEEIGGDGGCVLLPVIR